MKRKTIYIGVILATILLIFLYSSGLLFELLSQCKPLGDAVRVVGVGPGQTGSWTINCPNENIDYCTYTQTSPDGGGERGGTTRLEVGQSRTVSIKDPQSVTWNFYLLKWVCLITCPDESIAYRGECPTTPITTTTTILPNPPEPTLPNPLAWLLEKITGFINWLRSLFGFQIFQAKESYKVGSSATFDIEILLSAIDADYSDGTYQKRYGLWFVTDIDGNIIDNGEWMEVSNSYVGTSTIIAPSEGTYYFVALVNQYDYVFSDAAMDWIISEPVTISKESATFNTYLITPPPEPTLPSILEWLTNVIGGFLSWLRSLWPF